MAKRDVLEVLSVRSTLPLPLAIARPVLFLAIAVLGLASSPGDPADLALHTISAALLIATSAILGGWAAAPERWRRLAALAELAVVSLLSATAAAHGTGNELRTLFIPVSVTLPLILPRRYWVPVLGITLAAWFGTGWLDWRQDFSVRALLEMIVFGVALLVSGAVGMLLVRLTEERERSLSLLADLEESNAALARTYRQLQESVAHRQEMAVLEERQRLAREIHDSVAHLLTALTVQIQAGRRLLASRPDEAAVVIQRCEELSREALTETRRAVRALHHAGFEGETELIALLRVAREYQEATGMVVEVSADEPSKRLPPDPERLDQLVRIFQEALSNAHRHGSARHVRAGLSVRDGESLSCVIANDGATPDHLAPGTGLGLQSMAERVRRLGGSIRYEPGSPGVTIHLTIPLQRDTGEGAR